MTTLKSPVPTSHPADRTGSQSSSAGQTICWEYRCHRFSEQVRTFNNLGRVGPALFDRQHAALGRHEELLHIRIKLRFQQTDVQPVRMAEGEGFEPSMDRRPILVFE